MKKNIVLIGFMGTGKSAVGALLAKRLQRRFISMDAELERRLNKPIERIFKEDGEECFREAERALAQELSALENVVIDTGGGVVLDPRNVQALKRHGLLIGLTARPEVIEVRTKPHADRPLLAGGPPLVTIRRLLSERAAHYAIADHIVETSTLTIEETVDAIEAWLAQHSPQVSS